MSNSGLLPYPSNTLDLATDSQESSNNTDLMGKEIERIRKFFFFADLTLVEKKMIEDWIQHLSSFSPPEQAVEWKAIQRNIRKHIAARRDRGENLLLFREASDFKDDNGQLVSGRMMFRTIEWRVWKTLQIPLTENCNLLCKHCTRTRKFVNKDLSYDEFRTFLSKFNPYQFENLLLSNFGEPFLRKDFLDILRYVKSRGFNRVEVVTTGNLISESLRKAIVNEQLLSRVLVSIEGASKTLYEDIRGSSFEGMKSCIKALIDYRKKMGQTEPSVFFNVVCLKENIQELPLMLDLAHELEIDGIFFVHLSGVVSEMSNNDRKRLEGKLLFKESHLNHCDRELILDVFRQIESKSKRYGIPFEPPENYLGNTEAMLENKAKKTRGCNKPYEWIQVKGNGDVFPCCQIAQRYSVGNVLEKTFEEVWNGKIFKEFREGLGNGRPNAWCEVCNIYNGKRF